MTVRLRIRMIWRLTILAMILALLWAGGCSRPSAVPRDESSAEPDHQAPFQGDGTRRADPNPAESSEARYSAATTENSLPFHDPSLPAGTLLMVRLKSPISSGNMGTNNSFEAIVDEPIVIAGNTLIPRGATAAGRVESARSSKVKPNRGYVRLALASVQVEGVDVPVQTASLFVRQVPASEISPMVRLEKGHRLTFRLTEPVYTTNQRAHSGH